MLQEKVDTQAVLEVRNPVALAWGGTDSKLAPRPASLEGLTVGLLWNGKPQGDAALNHVGEQLKARFANLKTILYPGSIRFEKQILKRAQEECDVVVTAVADCGACTSWLIHDSIEMEKHGVPAVTIVSKGFEIDAEATAAAFDLAQIKYVVVPRVYQALTPEQAIEQTGAVIDDIVRLLTDVNNEDNTSVLPDVLDETLNFSGGDLLEVQQSFNDFYLSQEWGDGYPLYPPTPERVDALIEAVGAPRDELVCLLNPGMGHATVEKVAINCAMSGCTPDEMLIVMAALRAISKVPPPLDKSVLMSTGAFAPLVLVNGPIAEKVGINGARCCLGPGKNNLVNIRVGRAVTLSLKNLGRWVPGMMDMDTIGTPRKFNMCLGENLAETPWEPYHVTQGFRPDESTVTVFHTTGEWDYDVGNFSGGDQLLKKIAVKVPAHSQVGYWTTILGHLRGDEDQRLILLPPDHAKALAESGISKDQAQRTLHQYIRLNLAEMALHRPIHRVRPEFRWIYELSEEERRRQLSVPAFGTPDCIKIAVVGSHTPKALAYGVMTAPITEAVTTSPKGR
jgi:hypothetical protein